MSGTGSYYKPPTKPQRGERWLRCPVLGILFPESQGVWRKGRLVHPLANDKLGYREVESEPPPSPFLSDETLERSLLPDDEL